MQTVALHLDSVLWWILKNKNLSSLLADDVFHKRVSIGMTPSAVHINGIETLDKLVLDTMYIKPA